MYHFVLLSVFVALACAQYPTTEGPSQIIGIPGPRWQGPLADHVLGRTVGDTPEVAAAKAAHYKAHAQILEILPVLPAEERYGTVSDTQPQQQVYIPQQQSHVPQQVYQPGVHITIPSSVHAPVVHQQVQNNPQLIQFAEEIPRSELGEVPEVAAARKAHLAAFAEIERLLPKLEKSTGVVSGVQQPLAVGQQRQNLNQYSLAVNQHPQALYQQPLQRNQEWFYNPQQFNSYVPQDTPEVAAAKAEHLRLLQQALH